MTKEQIKSYFEDVLAKLWPKWKTNDAQVSTWAKALRPFDYRAVRRAAQEHFTSQEGSYGKPKLYAIVEKARAYQPATDAPRTDSADYEPDVFIQCTGHDTKPGNVCWYNAVTVAPCFRDNRDYVMSAAENMRRRFEACYGGTWIIIQQTTEHQMQQLFADHRAKKNAACVNATPVDAEKPEDLA